MKYLIRFFLKHKGTYLIMMLLLVLSNDIFRKSCLVWDTRQISHPKNKAAEQMR